MKLALGLILLSQMLLVNAAWSAGFNRQNYPLPIDTDDSEVRSSLYLELEAKRYDMPLEKFVAQQLDAREAVFAQVLQAARKQDYGTFTRLWETPEPVAQNNTSRATAPAQPQTLPPAQMLDLMREMMANLDNVTVIAQVLVGSESVFVWEAKTPKVSRRAAFIVRANAAKKLMVRDVSSFTDPIPALFMGNMRAAAKTPQAYQPEQALTLPFRYTFPVEGKGNPGEAPVYLRFAGKAFNFNVFDQATPSSDPILAFYQKAYLVFKKRSFDDFMGFFSPGSQRKLKQLFLAMNKEALENFYQSTTKGRYVKFVINADPVYIVFYSANSAEQWVPGSLAFDYVLKDPKSGNLMLTNFGYEAVLDDVLRDRALFDQQIFKSHPAAPAQGPASR